MRQAPAREHQRQFRDLRLQGAHLLLEQAQLMAPLGFVRVRTDRSPALLAGRSASWPGHWFGSQRGQGRGQGATMQLGHLLELWEGETFEASIARIQTTGEVGSFEPEAQGFGIHP